MRLFTLCAYLKTKESYDRWVTRRVWGFDIKYLKQNISRCRSEISGSFRRNSVALYTERKNLRVSAIRGSGHVCLGKLKLPPLPFGCEISGCEMSANGIPDVNVDGRNSSPRVEWAMSQGGPSACARCRDPSPWWHRVRIAIQHNSILIPQEDTRRHAIRINSIRIPSGGHAPPCYPDSLREKHTALVSITLRTIAYPIRIGCPDGKTLTKVSKPCYVIPTTCHSSRSAADYYSKSAIS